MHDFSKLSFQKILKLIVIIAAIVISANNTRQLIQSFNWPQKVSMINLLKNLNQSPGQEYSNFKVYLENVSSIGFLTNKPMSAEKNDGQFLAAQYSLAPIVLKLQDSDESWLILDFDHPTLAFTKLNNLNATIVEINHYGKILAQKK